MRAPFATLRATTRNPANRTTSIPDQTSPQNRPRGQVGRRRSATRAAQPNAARWRLSTVTSAKQVEAECASDVAASVTVTVPKLTTDA